MKWRTIVITSAGGVVVLLGIAVSADNTSAPSTPTKASGKPSTTTASPTPVPSATTGTRTIKPSALRSIISGLKVATEAKSGYDRDLFDYQSSSTRKKVLAQEKQPDGTWYSIWDEQVYTNASDLDIDHTVALKEAWDSGANKWSATKRRAFANDTSNPYTLNAITDNLNQSKGSDDGRWAAPENRCEYVRQIAVIKGLWGLSIDLSEKAVMLRVANGCPA